MNLLAWIIALLFFALGLLAYLGLWKNWMRVARGYGSFMGFCCLYIGVGMLSAGVAVTIGVRTPIGSVLIVIAAALMLLAIVGFWWLPSFLQPAWFRRSRAGALGRRSAAG
ncbi:hypothetical protein R8Z57_09445 [Microbacterium sp. M3]|uniref:Uncharacterized protein n=1 Tax=Microbacterium arthrosphaerae TaxID=792652 RepID=A0ABU4H2T8_9MICO|nr:MULTISPECIES: hypothetical protein [Microbacterium]MDW4572990.1 hypothetical protein [Microbacterium arthrosphaerae]MDW7606845.1 hypothetical protein [Microbacterium sp. M3]